jgi:general secretion pathway protein C
MTLGNYNLNQLWLQLNKQQKSINLLIVVILSLYLLAYGAELSWRLLPTPEGQLNSTPGSPSINPANRQNNQTDLSKLKALNLFGELGAAPKTEVEEVSEAPQTSLNLTLTGVVASSEKEQGAAIIDNKGSQNTYGIDEKIDGTNAILKEVFADRVIIKNGARRETLMLDGLDFNKSSANNPIVRSPSARPEPKFQESQHRELSEEAIEATRALQQQPANFSDYIAISPHRVDGQLIGYAVSPGKNPALFQEVGMQSGDVIVEINGLDLTDTQQSMEAMGALRAAQSLQLTVTRDGELLTLYLDLPTAELEP